MHTATSLNLLFDYDFRLDVCEQLRRVHAAGFRYIDMNFWDWGHSEKSPFMQDGWQDWVKRIKETGDELGIRFHQSHCMALNPYDGNPINEWRAEAARRSIIGSGMLGIDWTVFHVADRNGGWGVESPDDPKFADEEQQIACNHEFIEPYLELAVKNNVGIALENMNGRSQNKFSLRYPTTAEQLDRLVDSFRSESVGVCWDIGHAHCQQLNQYDEIIKLGHRLKVLHVQDNNGQSDQHTAPFYGTVDWKAVKRALEEIGYAGEFTFEAHMLIRRCPDDITRDAAARLLFRIGEYIVNM